MTLDLGCLRGPSSPRALLMSNLPHNTRLYTCVYISPHDTSRVLSSLKICMSSQPPAISLWLITATLTLSVQHCTLDFHPLCQTCFLSRLSWICSFDFTKVSFPSLSLLRIPSFICQYTVIGTVALSINSLRVDPLPFLSINTLRLDLLPFLSINTLW